MKKLLAVIVALAGVAAFAADATTIKGEGKCAKCCLKETDKCQNAVTVKKDGKEKTYYLVQNDVSKAFHKNLCSANAEVTATGTVKEVDGKLEFTATKIELVK